MNGIFILDFLKKMEKSTDFGPKTDGNFTCLLARIGRNIRVDAKFRKL